VPVLQRRALKAIRGLFTPLLPDDYLELINPLWSTQELRGRIERVERETGDAATIFIKPGWEWPSHEPGQYLRIGVVIDGVHHWRAYSLTSDPGRPDGCISITPKLVEEGVVSPFFVRQAKPGAIVRLGGVEGTFMLPSPLPEKLLFITAGSGITPVMSMLRHLERREHLTDVVHLHSARTEDAAIFDCAVVDIAAAESDVQRSGERRLDNAGVGTWMLAGVAANRADCFPGDAANQRRPGCGRQCRHPCRNPVEQIIEPGSGPAKPQVARRMVPDHGIQGIDSAIAQQSRQAGDCAPHQRCHDSVGSVLRNGLDSGPRHLFR